MKLIAKFAALPLLSLIVLTAPSVSEQHHEFDTPPMPKQGMAALAQAVVYPATAAQDGLEGKVLVSMVIDKHGKTLSAEIITGVREDLDKAALEAVRKVEWTPALKDNTPVVANVVVPIMFKLDANKNK